MAGLALVGDGLAVGFAQAGGHLGQQLAGDPRVAVEHRRELALAQHEQIGRLGRGDRGVADGAVEQRQLAEVLPGTALAYAPPADWALALDRALPQLDRLAPAGKELVVRALTRAIGADDRVCVAEAELLRTVCAALHCPLPPLMNEAN